MTDAINAKNDVLNDQELDAVSGGFIYAAFLPGAYTAVLDMVKGQQAGPESSPTKDGGGQNDPAQMFADFAAVDPRRVRRAGPGRVAMGGSPAKIRDQLEEGDGQSRLKKFSVATRIYRGS